MKMYAGFLVFLLLISLFLGITSLKSTKEIASSSGTISVATKSQKD